VNEAEEMEVSHSHRDVGEDGKNKRTVNLIGLGVNQILHRAIVSILYLSLTMEGREGGWTGGEGGGGRREEGGKGERRERGREEGGRGTGGV
jgi:hypothetical protein